MKLSVAITKRGMDIGISLSVLILGSPLFLLIAILIKLDSPGPILYCQKRIRRCYSENHQQVTCPEDKDTFYICKFRTMVENAEYKTGSILATEDDTRVTRVGKWLRRYRLDEVPNFWNVLKGDMSVVGPRADRIEEGKKIEAEFPLVWERTRFVKPGITGWAQVMLRSDGTAGHAHHPLLRCLSLNEIKKPVLNLRYKMYYDFAYAIKMMDFWSFLKTDFKIILLTPYVMFFRQNGF